MKIEKVVTTSLVVLTMLSALLLPASLMAVGSVPQVSGSVKSSGTAPLLVKGPQATPVDATASNDGVTYGLFSCQVGLSTGACYDPYQMRTAYGIAPLIAAGYNGFGKTIIIVDAFQDPNIVQQLNYFDAFYGLPGLNGLGGAEDPTLGTFTQVAPDGLTPFVQGDPNMTGWAEEISLDVLWAHAIAPGANIVLELGTDNSDEALVSAINDAIDNNRGDVISMSFGESDQCLGTDLSNAWHQAFANATKKGITLFASSGDQGVEQPSCDGNSWIKSTSSPAADPLVTSVGGTELQAADYCLVSLGCDPTAHPAPGTYQAEIAWNEGPTGDFQANFTETLASGGGFSTVFAEPAYQQGTNNGGKSRGVPDVAYNAAVLHGVLTYLNIPGVPAGFYRFGGTSAGSPQWAALLAIADQADQRDFGFINAALYKIGQAMTAYTNAFNDITEGNNSAIELDSDNNLVAITGYNAGLGWDAVTGLGSPKAGSIVSVLPMFWSAGQGVAAIAGSMPRPTGKPPVPGFMGPN
jgi:subtilase family serine protease